MKTLDKYTIILEEGPQSYGATVEELPGCVAVGRTREEVLRLINEAIDLHEEAEAEDDIHDVLKDQG